MTKTERAYLAQVLNYQARFEPVTFRLLGGCRYTPDFLSVEDGVLTFHEVKGSYRLESEGRAWTAFNEAAALFPFFRWVWAVKNKKSDSSAPSRHASSDPADNWTIKLLIEPDSPAPTTHYT